MILCFPISIHWGMMMNDTEDEFIWCDFLLVFTNLLYTSFCFLQAFTKDRHFFFPLLPFYTHSWVWSSVTWNLWKAPIDFKRHWKWPLYRLYASGLPNATISPTPPHRALYYISLKASPLTMFAHNMTSFTLLPCISDMSPPLPMLTACGNPTEELSVP